MSQTLSLGEFAELAGVQRPVATVWQTRPVPGHPFPALNESGRLDAVEAIDWLQATGRGKLPGDGALGLLGLRSTADRLAALAACCVLPDLDGNLTQTPDLAAAARSIDPHDDFLVSELNGADDLSAVCELVDRVMTAVPGNRDAYNAIRERLLRSHPDLFGSSLSAALTELLADLIEAFADTHTPLLVDIGGTANEAITRLAAREALDAEVRVVDLKRGSASRDALRSYRALGQPAKLLAAEADWLAVPDSIGVAILPSDVDEALGWLTDLDLELLPGRTALVVGKATLLCDETTDRRVSQFRDEAIRLRRLRAVVRLPQGLDRARERDHLGLWVLRPVPDVDSQPAPLFSADLSGRALDASLSTVLISDLVAALGPLRSRRQLIVLTGQDRAQTVIAGHALTQPAVATRTDLSFRPAEVILAAHESMARVAEPCDTSVGAIGFAPTGLPAISQQVSLGAAVAKGLVQLRSGVRLTQLRAGTTPLWDAAAVRAGSPRVGVDLFALVRAHPGMQLSAPGDVVFTVSPPAAAIDSAGGAVVSYPARILRTVSPTVSAHLLARAINAQHSTDRRWQAWQIPQVDNASPVDAALDRITAARQRIATRLRELQDLETHIADAAISGTVQITTEETPHGTH